MRTFTAYRRRPPESKVPENYNALDEGQYEGVVFSDGTVAIRWLTEFKSTSVWESMEMLVNVHGHASDYGTEFHWDDGSIERLG